LNVGAIVALAPDLSALASVLGVDEDTVRLVLNSWGPGKLNELDLSTRNKRCWGSSSTSTPT